MNGFILRAGGKGIRFSVKSYNSATELPPIAAENSFAIISETPVSKYTVSSTKPESGEDGEVWVNASQYVNDFSFNALSKNKFIITPIDFQQWNGQEWVPKEKYAYKNGKWNNMAKFIIASGRPIAPTLPVSQWFKVWPNATKIQEKDGYISISGGSDPSSDNITILGEIDFKGYSRLIVDYYIPRNFPTSAHIRLLKEKMHGEHLVDQSMGFSTDGKRQRLVFDWPKIVNSGYIGFAVDTITRAEVQLHNIWLE